MTKYEIRDGKKWVTAKKASQESAMWLRYELTDGTFGLTYNKKNVQNWRIKQPKAK